MAKKKASASNNVTVVAVLAAVVLGGAGLVSVIQKNGGAVLGISQLAQFLPLPYPLPSPYITPTRSPYPPTPTPHGDPVSPSPRPITPVPTGTVCTNEIKSFSVNTSCGANLFRYMNVQCANGATNAVSTQDAGVCRDIMSWATIAMDVCLKNATCRPSPTPTPFYRITPTTYPRPSYYPSYYPKPTAYPTTYRVVPK